MHYWTPTAKLALDLGYALRLPAGRLAWDVFLLYGRGARWDAGVPVPGYWQHQLDILQGEPFDPGALGAQMVAALRAQAR